MLELMHNVRRARQCGTQIPLRPLLAARLIRNDTPCRKAGISDDCPACLTVKDHLRCLLEGQVHAQPQVAVREHAGGDTWGSGNGEEGVRQTRDIILPSVFSLLLQWPKKSRSFDLDPVAIKGNCVSI